MQKQQKSLLDDLSLELQHLYCGGRSIRWICKPIREEVFKLPSLLEITPLVANNYR